MTVRIAVPASFDLEALAHIEVELARAPAQGAVQLDFASVRECHAFVLARLVFGLAREKRTPPVELVNLSERQKRLLLESARSR